MYGSNFNMLNVTVKSFSNFYSWGQLMFFCSDKGWLHDKGKFEIDDKHEYMYID